MLSSVDLPQPEWPMMETYSPFSIVRLISLQHFGRGIAAGEGLVDVVELQIGLHDMILQFSAVPRVTIFASPAIRRSSTKPMMPT